MSPKLFCNSWANSYVQFLVIISCFTFPPHHDYGFSKKVSNVNINFERRDLNFSLKSHLPPDDLGEICFFLCFWFRKTKCNRFFFHIFFFSIRVFFTGTDDSQDSREREGTIYSTLPFPPAHEHWDIYLQLCMWDDYQVF